MLTGIRFEKQKTKILMGEYVKIGGNQVKLGTCEDLYYCTIPQFKLHLPFMKKVVDNSEPKDYLTDGVSRFRFPFPDEDHLSIGEHPNFSWGWHVRLNRADEDVAKLFPKGDSGWEDIKERVHSKTQSHLSVLATCPNPNKDAAFVDIEIVQQKILSNGIIAVIYRDPYTGNKARIEDPTEALMLAKAILRTAPPVDAWNKEKAKEVVYIMEMAKRIVDGYGIALEIPETVEV